MNILFVYYYPSGGVETLARQRSLALKPYGIKFHFLYYAKGPGLQNIKREKTFITHSDEEIRQILTEGNYAAIIVCSDHLFTKKARDFGYKGVILYEVQGLGSYQQADNWLQSAQTTIRSNADALLYPKTPHLIQLIDKYYPDMKKFSFPNCIATKIFKYKPNTKHPQPIIGWVGRIEKNKNWEAFLEIGARLLSLNPKLELWMFEDDSFSAASERTHFAKKVEELQLTDKLKIYKNLPHKQMPYYYSQIGHSGGFLCSTSRVEGFGYAVLEAMSCRCPVLCSNSDGILNIVTHNFSGKIFPQDDLDTAVMEARELLSNSAERTRLSQTALNQIQLHFTPSQYAAHFLDMLKDLHVNNP
ncbi:glycosyltransferase family 4 protein [Neobacillus sp. SM06]|uniref:glycosyltransferase family 4 protein n=1 Tax=Neobacillus sp. SM06 TaxID=3422492 RepID=UPI003D2E5DA4